MKSLFYESRNIDFKSPNNISFLNDFQKKLYTILYERFPSNDLYQFYFDTDRISSGQLNINLIEEFKSEGLTFKSKDRKLGEKLSEKDRNILRNQIIIRNYLFDDFPEFLGLFNNNINKQNHCIDNDFTRD